jgi:hypothetical protein
VEGLRFKCFIRKKIEIRHGELLPKPAMPIRIGNQMAIMPLPFPILAYANDRKPPESGHLTAELGCTVKIDPFRTFPRCKEPHYSGAPVVPPSAKNNLPSAAPHSQCDNDFGGVAWACMAMFPQIAED